MKRKFKQRWSTIWQISTKRTITYHFNSLNTKQGPATYNAGNPGPGLRYTQKYGEKEGQQFHKYQQNERSHITLTCLTQRSGPSTYDIGNSGPDLRHAHTYGDLSRLLWSQPHPLDKDFYIIRCYNILTRKPI